MAELLAVKGPWKAGGAHLALNLFCASCNVLHELSLEDTEQLVYELTAMATAETRGGFEDCYDCFLDVLKEGPSQFVLNSIGKREISHG